MSAQPVEWFKPTSGRVTGVLAIAVAAVVLVMAVVGKAPAVFALGALLFGLLAWVTLLRPRLGLRGDTLLMRGMLSTVEIPVAAVDSVAVRQVLAVWAGERRYVSAAVGLPYRDIARERRRPDHLAPERPGADAAYAHHVGDAITSRSRQARADGVPGGDVRRHWARPELAGLAVLAVAFVVALVL